MESDRVVASVGMSRKWDAREAGREVAEKTLQKLQGNPNLFLLFSTIHYEKQGGFHQFLEGVWEVLPEGTPLVGGTVAGFVNNEGCFTRGASALAIHHPEMDVSIAIGKNTKRNPNRAAKQCFQQLKSIDQSRYRHKFLVNFISGPSIPQVPLLGKINTIKSRLLGGFLSHIGMRLSSIAGYGIGKEEDIIEKLSSLFPEYHIIGGSTIDDGKMFHSIQFCGKECFKKNMVCVGIATDSPFFLDGGIGLHKTHIKLNITGTAFNDRIITKIDGKPAKSALLQSFGLSESAFRDLDLLYRTTFYYPVGFDGNEEYSTGIGAIAGNNIMLAHKVKNDHACLLSAAGKDIIGTIDTVLQDYDSYQYHFAFGSSCEARLETLGNKIFTVKEKFDTYFQSLPYLVLYMGGEHLGIPHQASTSRIHSINVLSI